MRLLLFLARAFIDTFGITAPTPQNERRAAWFILVLLLLVLLAVFGTGIVLRLFFRHQ